MGFRVLPKDVITNIYMLLNNEDKASLLASSKEMCLHIDWFRLYHNYYSPTAKEQHRIQSEKFKARIAQMMKEQRIRLGIDHLFQNQ